jgi:hypothetical protein
MRSLCLLAVALSAFITTAIRSQDAMAVNIEFECPHDLPGARMTGTTVEDIVKTLDYCTHYLWLSGEFAAGDYERVHGALRARGEPVYGVRLFASPGGNLDEAMKIGELVRRLRLGTLVATIVPDGFLLDSIVLKSDGQAVCASACVYVWLSGIVHLGSWKLVIHRPYFDAAYFSSLSSEEADAKYAELESRAYNFLRKMGAPEQLIVMMKKVSSSDGQVLDEEYVLAELNVTSPGFDEWLTSRCGADIGSRRLLEIMRNAKELGGQEHLPADQASELARGLCRGKERKQAVLDAWKNEFSK